MELLLNIRKILFLLLWCVPVFGRRAQICECKEYWSCVLNGGEPAAFCGLQDTEVCCFPKQKWNTECGVKGPDLVQKDGLAGPGEWPWHAAILEKNAVYVCGASLIDEYWILTAAHCVDKYEARSLKVRLGEYDVSSIKEPILHEERFISDIVVHPEFDNKTLINDIAILRLKVPAEKKSNIDIVCVPDLIKGFGRNNSCYITGWGRRSEDTKHSVVLKEVPVPLWKNSDCQVSLRKHFGSRFILSNSSICAGAEGRDACDGDGGGPLVCEENGIWYQVGVVSFGVGCGRRDIPGVYTRVQNYQEWILNTVLQHRPKRIRISKT